MNTAEQIKSYITMSDVLDKYGFIPNRSGFIKCPFHSEKTPSLHIKGNRFKCYGCGKSGSIIDFVMLLFGISFTQAIVRLNADFNLGLTNRKPSMREIARLKAEREKREYIAYMAKQELLAHTKEFMALWQLQKTMPKTLDGAWARAKALHRLTVLDHWFDTH